jgi:hypothetical protein
MEPCGSRCTYATPTQIRTKVEPYIRRDRKTLVTEHLTATGTINGRCLTKAAALRRMAA